jgi:membrane protease YdiL (CAAX protease family)
MAERAEIGKRAVWPAFAACAVAFVAGSMASAILALAVGWARTSGKLARLPDEAVRYVLSPSGFIASNALNAAVLFATAVLGARMGNGSVRASASLRLGPSRASALGLGSAIAGMIGLSLACGAATDLLHARGRSIMDVLAQALRAPTLLRFALGLVTIAAAPALAEESLFRGLLQTRLMPRWGTRWAVVASSATFAAFHVDLVQGACAFVAGLFLGRPSDWAASVPRFWHTPSTIACSSRSLHLRPLPRRVQGPTFSRSPRAPSFVLPRSRRSGPPRP